MTDTRGKSPALAAVMHYLKTEAEMAALGSGRALRAPAPPAGPALWALNGRQARCSCATSCNCAPSAALDDDLKPPTARNQFKRRPTDEQRIAVTDDRR